MTTIGFPHRLSEIGQFMALVLAHLSYLLPVLIGMLWFRSSPRHWLHLRLYGAALLLGSVQYLYAIWRFYEHSAIWYADAALPTLLFGTGVILCLVPQARDGERLTKTFGLIGLGLSVSYIVGGAAACAFHDSVYAVAFPLALTALPGALRTLRGGAPAYTGKGAIYLVLPMVTLRLALILMSVVGLLKTDVPWVNSPTWSTTIDDHMFWDPFAAYSLPVFCLWNCYAVLGTLRTLYARPLSATAPSPF